MPKLVDVEAAEKYLPRQLGCREATEHFLFHDEICQVPHAPVDFDCHPPADRPFYADRQRPQVAPQATADPLENSFLSRPDAKKGRSP